MKTIIGAGLSGLIAAHFWPKAEIHEADSTPSQTHKAILRFRSEDVSRATGTEFQRVRVHKAVWYQDELHSAANLRMANLYARKITPGAAVVRSDRSIWSLEPVDRWIAPDQFYEMLIEATGSRIHWGSQFDFRSLRGNSEPLISTVPLPVLLTQLGVPCSGLDRRKIRVDRYRLDGYALYQTIYFPEQDTPVYRASITGSTLIIEAVGTDKQEYELEIVLDAFGIHRSCAEFLDTTDQRYGKIIPLPAAQRNAILYRLTTDYGIYSLGRFATWRNVLLDDVVQDCAVIKRLASLDHYARIKHASAN